MESVAQCYAASEDRWVGARFAMTDDAVDEAARLEVIADAPGRRRFRSAACLTDPAVQG